MAHCRKFSQRHKPNRNLFHALFKAIWPPSLVSLCSHGAERTQKACCSSNKCNSLLGIAGKIAHSHSLAGLRSTRGLYLGAVIAIFKPGDSGNHSERTDSTTDMCRGNHVWGNVDQWNMEANEYIFLPSFSWRFFWDIFIHRVSMNIKLPSLRFPFLSVLMSLEFIHHKVLAYKALGLVLYANKSAIYPSKENV